MNNSEAYEPAESIAIIGMSGRFPGAKNIHQFWQNLRDGVESISFFSDEELESAGIDPALLHDPNYVKAGGILEEVDLFDASFFGFNARDAEIMDPQHRLFLECAWESLEHAGYDSETYEGLIGVFAGTAMSSYLFNLYSNSNLLGFIDDFQIMLGNDKDHLTTHVSYKLNLRGPSVVVQTACSTSLVAVCMACHSLLNYQCDMALAGGAAISVPQKKGYHYQRGGIVSPDGHCRAFDAAGQGTVGGNGLGVVVLKRLSEAVADGDYIHAVIKGMAVNNDGSLKVGYTAPSVDGQAQVIAMAQAMAGVAPETVTYIEAHGTATPLGDPIEIAALTQVFGAASREAGFCAIGSVKTNIGHLDPAAGVAGLIKTVLALHHKELPPSLHFTRANPQINFAASPFYVNTKLSEWKAGRTPRRAGVSSFGIGGTNAHVVLEEAPTIKTSGPSRPWQVLMLSAKTSAALESATDNLVEYIKQHPDVNLADVAYVCQVGRRAFRHRRILLCRDLNDAVGALESRNPARVFTANHEPRHRPVVFMFSGQGAQYVHMASELYQVEATFREQVDLCSELLKPHLELDLRRVIFPNAEQADEAAQQLTQTGLTQPALFVIEYALAKLWMAGGVSPQAMIGHSIGEYVAACLSGVFSLEDALAIVAARGRLMEQMPGGAMLAVPLSEREMQPLLGENLSLAAVNGPSLCVVSGTTEAVEQLAGHLAENGLVCRRLHTSHAFHSKMMDPILEAFSAQVKRVNLNPPAIPYVTNVTGTWVTAEAATDPSFWAKHLRQTVRFGQGARELLQDPDWILLEVGPGRTLSTFIRQHSDVSAEQLVLSSLRHPQDQQSDVAFLLNTLGRLWLAGIQINWAGFYAQERRQRLPLPTYPFQRERYWIGPQEEVSVTSTEPAIWLQPQDIANWFYIPSWKLAPQPALPRQTAHRSHWLVFSDTCGVGSRLVERLMQDDQDVFTVLIGERFSRHSEQIYAINPRRRDDYDALLKELRLNNKSPETIVHLWSVTPPEEPPPGIDSFEQSQDLGFYSLLFLAQALDRQNISAPLQIGVISNQMQAVTGDEPLCPAKATVLGPCKVIQQEYPNVMCRSIDIVLPESNSRSEDELIDHLMAELTSEKFDSVVAFRHGRRWVQTFEPVRVDGAAAETSRLRKGGVYLITGGLGGISLVLAEHLARTVQAKLVLIGRSAFPEREDWSCWLAHHDDKDEVSRKIRRVQAMEQMGAHVLVLNADVANQEQMENVVARVSERFGDIHGVIHGAGNTAADSFTAMNQTDRAGCDQHFQPKAHGLIIMDKVLERKNLDFCLLLSSLSSILGGLGFVAYSAANIFMDAFAQKQNHTKSAFWVSVNWDGWQLGDEDEHSGTEEPSGRNLILPKDGMEAFQRILTRGQQHQIVVSTSDLQARFDQWINLETLRGTPQLEESSSSGHARPNVANPYVAPRNEVERAIAAIWQQLLGVTPIGIHDNFFELGGHSLLAIKLISRLHDAFHVELSVHELFTAPTVSELAENIDKSQRAAHGEEDKIAEMLALVEQLSESEVKRMLGQEYSPKQSSDHA